MFGTKNSRWDDSIEYTPLHEAASRGDFQIFKYIFDQVNEKNPTNDNGYTPFHVAANYESHFEI
jgi:ankyrin repeat protein